MPKAPPRTAVDDAQLAAATVAALGDPPADGQLLYRVTDRARAAGFVEGDIVVALGDRPTRTAAEFDAAFRVKVAGDVTYRVHRDGREIEVRADRFAAQHCGPLALVRGTPVQARPPATTELSVVHLDSPVDLWAERRTNAYGLTKGARSRKGYEHHRLVAAGKETVELTSRVAFTEFGDEFGFDATSVTRLARRKVSWTWRDERREAVVTAATSGGSVQIDAEAPSDRAQLRHPVLADLVPSLLVPLAALLLPRESGAAAHVCPVPEDAAPWWVPPGTSSYFPLDDRRLPKTVVCRGVEALKVGRTAQQAWRYEAVALDRVWCTTWVDDEGSVLGIDRGANGLVPCARDAARL